MFKRIFDHKPFLLLLIFVALFSSSCIRASKKVRRAQLLLTTSAPESDLVAQIAHLANLGSLNAKMWLYFEDNSHAAEGTAKKYIYSNAKVVIQPPSNILLKVEAPGVGVDLAEMTSNGEKFRVAVYYDKYRSFLSGTNNVDYSSLERKVGEIGKGDKKEKKSASVFSKIRPQHFLDALIVQPIDRARFFYVRTTINQEEFDIKANKKSPTRWVIRGYYLFDEYRKTGDGALALVRRFWFDRVGGMNLSRLQTFDSEGEIESDVVYGKMGAVTETGEYQLPLEIVLTRPKEKYRVTLQHAAPKAAKIGKDYPGAAFVLINTKNLREIDLDQQLLDQKNGNGAKASVSNK